MATLYSSNGAKQIDWIFFSALLKRSILPLIFSYVFYHLLLTLFTQQHQPHSLRVMLFLMILWMNICHYAYLHSYLPLNYHFRSSHIIYSLMNLTFGWIIGILLHQILYQNQTNTNNEIENVVLKFTPSLVAILTLFSCGYFSQPLIPKSLIPPSLPLLFRQSMISSLKRITIQLFFFFGLLSLFSLLIGLCYTSIFGIIPFKFFSRGFTTALILHLVYSFTNESFSIMITYPMNFSKLSSASTPSTLLCAITGTPRWTGTKNKTQKISSNTYFPFHLQYHPSSSPSLELTPSPSVMSTSSQPQTPKPSSSTLPSLLSSSSNDFHLKWKSLFSFQNQINLTLFEYLEVNYRSLPGDGPAAIATAVLTQSWCPNYEPMVLPNLSRIYQIDANDVNQNSSKSSPSSWSSSVVSFSFILPSVLSSSFLTPIKAVYSSLRQTLALHDLSRIARSSSTSPRKAQLLQSPESLSTLTHALLTLVSMATLQVSTLPLIWCSDFTSTSRSIYPSVPSSYLTSPLSHPLLPQINILTCHGQVEILDTVGHKSNLLATFYSHLLDSNPVKLPLPKHWFFRFLLRVLKWLNSILKFSNYFHHSRVQDAVAFEISPNINLSTHTTTSASISGSGQKTVGVTVEAMKNARSSSLSLFYNRREEREDTLIGAICNAFVSVIPTVAQQMIKAVPFSSPLSRSFTEDVISAIESLTFLLITEPHSSSSLSSSASFAHHYLPIIISTLISFELQLKDYINYRILLSYSKNCSSFSQYLDYKLSPGVYYNIHQFNKRSSSAFSPRIISENLLQLEHVLEGSLNQIIFCYHDILLSTGYSYPSEVTKRIQELVKKRIE
jgi:hypothetical protein